MDDGQGTHEVVEARLLREPTLRDYLDDLVLRAGVHLGSGTEVCITLRHAGSDRLAAGSTERAARCDEVEYAVASGPCVTAADLMRVVLVPDIHREDRWPEWRTAALAEGYTAAAAVPAHVAQGVEVVLNLYAEQVDPWDRSVLLRADTYAQHVALTVGLCLQVAQLTTANTDARAELRELQLINRLLVAAVTQDEHTAAQLLDGVRDVVRAHSAQAQADVRSIIREVTGAPEGRLAAPHVAP